MQTTTDDLVLASRLERLRNVILSTYEAPLPEVTVYFYHDEVNGFCIGEIDAYWKLTDGGSGGRGTSWMQGDFDAAPVIYAAERFILNCDIPVQRPEGWDDNLDYAQEAEQRLVRALTGKRPDWVEKPLPTTA